MNTVMMTTAMSIVKGASIMMMTVTNIAAEENDMMTTGMNITAVSDTAMTGMSIAVETKGMSTVAAAMSATMMIAMSTDAMRTMIKTRKLLR